MGRAKSPEAIARKRERDKRYSQERRKWLKSLGFCTVCGCEFAEPGRCRCSKCAEDKRKRGAPWNAGRKVWRAQRRAAGLCIDCTGPAVEGRCRCARCLERERVNALARRVQRRIEHEADLARKGVYMR